MTHLIRAELHKAYDTRAAKIMIALTFIFACLILGTIIYVDKYHVVTDSASAGEAINHQLLTGGIGTILGLAASFSMIFLGIASIYLICQEWHHSLAIVTYVTTPRRFKVATAKLCAALILLIATTILLTLLCLIAGIIISKLYGVDYSTVIRFNEGYGITVLHLFLSIALATAMAYCIKNQTWAILFYLFLPFATKIIAGLPFIDKIQSWISLGTVPSPFAAGPPPHQEWYQILVSVLIWIVVPLGIGIVRSVKEDL